MREAVWEAFAADEDFEPLFTVSNCPVRLLGASHHEGIFLWSAGRPSVVQESHWVPEADIAGSTAPTTQVLLVDECESFADIVQVLRALHN